MSKYDKLIKDCELYIDKCERFKFEVMSSNKPNEVKASLVDQYDRLASRKRKEMKKYKIMAGIIAHKKYAIATGLLLFLIFGSMYLSLTDQEFFDTPEITGAFVGDVQLSAAANVVVLLVVFVISLLLIKRYKN